MNKNILTSTFVTISFLLLYACSPKLNAEKQTKIKSELEEMVKTDQIAANMPKDKYLAMDKAEWELFKDSIFSANHIKAEKLFHQYGFLGFDKVGKESSNHFWLIVQHCDKYPKFQKSVLKSMNKEVKKGNANPQNYAYLFDRVQVNANEKQLFGTQLTYEVNTTGRAIPKVGLIDSLHVDNLRKEYDLSTLKEYLNIMTQMHFEMNKAHYEKIGITEPALY